MSEIMVSIPLSALHGAEDLSAESLTDFFSNATEAQKKVEQEKAKYDALAQWVSEISARFTFILDKAPDEFTKVRELRNLQTELNQTSKGFAGHGN